MSFNWARLTWPRLASRHEQRLGVVWERIDQSGMTNLEHVSHCRGVLAPVNAGITSLAKCSSCSRATVSGTPTDKLTEMRSRAGYFDSSALMCSIKSSAIPAEETAGFHRILDARQLGARCPPGVAHDLDLLARR